MFQSFKFPRQTTRFTCGPATLAAVSGLLGKPVKETNIASAMGTRDFVGTKHEEMVKWAKENLPVKSYGSNTYHSGLAIANIQNKDSGNGHYVIFLGQRKDGFITYYCPLLGETVSSHTDDIHWVNGSGNVKNWSINIDIDIDFIDTEIRPEKHIFFLGDPVDELNKDTDTSLRLMSHYDSTNISTSWHSFEDIFIRGNVLYLSGRPVFKNDIVWLRFDPSSHIQYYTTLQQLCHINVCFLNSPHSILTCNDKKTANPYRRDCDVYTLYSQRSLDVAIRHLKVVDCTHFVLKPPNLFGGQDVLITDDVDKLKKHLDILIKKSGCAVLEKFIRPSQKVQIDTSVLVTWDRVIGAIAREAKDEFSITPYHQGSASKTIKGLSTNELKVVASVQKEMNEKGIFWAGLNFLEGELIEANISCPGGLIDMIDVYDIVLENEICNSAQKFAQKMSFEH